MKRGSIEDDIPPSLAPFSKCMNLANKCHPDKILMLLSFGRGLRMWLREIVQRYSLAKELKVKSDRIRGAV
jgi:hypothetical protein